MKFKTKLMKTIARFSKENGLYPAFKTNIKKLEKYGHLKCERDLLKKYHFSPRDIMYNVQPRKKGHFGPRVNGCIMYIYKEKEFETIKTMFENFLKEQNALDNFKRNIDITFIMENGREDLSKIDADAIKCTKDKYNALIENLSPYTFIEEAFSWKSSPQGHEFWQTLNSSWCKIIDKYIDEKYIGEDIKLEPQSITYTINTNSYTLSYTIT